MSYGMTSDGFNRKRLADIKTEIETSLKAYFGENIDLDPQSVFGIFVGIMAEREAVIWEDMENVYNSQSPNTAVGEQLSQAVQLNQLTRLAQLKSTVTVTFTGTPAAEIPAGSLVETSDTGIQFETLALATIGGGGTIDVAMESVDYGPYEADTGTLTVLPVAISGVTSVTNAAAAVPGRLQETDAELRIRRAASVAAASQNLEDSLYGQLMQLDGVTDAVVVSNRTDSADAYGTPAHQFLTVVLGGTQADILDVIWANTPQGIQSHGTTEVTDYIDAQGFEQTVKYTVPSEIDIHFDLTISVNSDVFPVDGDDQIKAAIAAYGAANFLIGDDVVYAQFYVAIMSIPGILTISFAMDTVDPPTGTANIVIDIDEVAAFDTDNIDISIT